MNGLDEHNRIIQELIEIGKEHELACQKYIQGVSGAIEESLLVNYKLDELLNVACDNLAKNPELAKSLLVDWIDREYPYPNDLPETRNEYDILDRFVDRVIIIDDDQCAVPGEVGWDYLRFIDLRYTK